MTELTRALGLPFEPLLFRERRERFLARASAGVALLPAAPELHRSRDTEIEYRPDSDLAYLTGCLEPQALALLTPHDPAHRFTLFVRPRDPERELWNGARPGVEGAKALFQADAVYPIAELAERLPALLEPADRILYALGADARLDARVIDMIAHFRRARQRSGHGPTAVEDPGVMLGEMRVVKDAAEIGALRHAAAISAAGQRAALATVRPGVGEWEVEAALEAAFRAASARGPAFASIVASGPNATVLHYTANDRVTRPGELLLLDAGAEWGLYCGDLTRTVPVSGRFSPLQRALYELVLAAEEAAIAAVRPGAPFSALHDAALRVLVAGLVEHHLLQGEVEALIADGAHKRFCPHQTSHYLGLDVHDVGLYARAGEPVPLQEGMVLTVEPGLYVPAAAEGVPAEYRGLGIRIEDTVLVTRDGAELLTRGVPVAPDEVAALVAGEA